MSDICFEIVAYSSIHCYAAQERERERELVRFYEQRHKETPCITAPKGSVDLNLTNNRLPNDYSLNSN